MSTPDRDASSTYGQPLANYSAVIDPTVDLDAGAFNRMVESVAQMTRMCPRAWARFTPAGSGTPVLTAHDAMWGNTPSVAPVVARSAQGVYTMTWPVTVNDAILSGSAGFNGPHTLNFLTSFANAETNVFWHINTFATTNAASIYLFDTSRTLQDPTGITFCVFVI